MSKSYGIFKTALLSYGWRKLLSDRHEKMIDDLRKTPGAAKNLSNYFLYSPYLPWDKRDVLVWKDLQEILIEANETKFVRENLRVIFNEPQGSALIFLAAADVLCRKLGAFYVENSAQTFADINRVIFCLNSPDYNQKLREHPGVSRWDNDRKDHTLSLLRARRQRLVTLYRAQRRNKSTPPCSSEPQR